MPNTHSIGAFLSALRKANGLTQKQLADKLNVSDKAVSRWERDECAPDLTLIPVLAELYGVTSDEIIRGQRKDPETQPTVQEEERSQKRLKLLLDKAEAAYKVRCVISVMLACFGLVVAMILNGAFSLSYAGFLCGCILFIASISCQICFSILHKTTLTSENFDPDLLAQHRVSILKKTEITYTAIAALMASTVPLLFSGGPCWGVEGVGWLIWGLLAAAVTVLICLCVCHIIHVKNGISQPINWRRVWKRIPHLAIWTLMLTVALNLLCSTLLEKHFYLYSDSTKFDDWPSFQTHMQTPTAPSGDPLIFVGQSVQSDGKTIRIYEDSTGQPYVFKPDSIHEIFYGKDGQKIGEFYGYNTDVWNLYYSRTDDLLPIYTQNSYQHAEWNQRLTRIMSLWILVYIVETVLLLRHYMKKQKHR